MRLIKAISIIFSCKQCSVSFDQVASYIKHKEANHFQELVNTKCIVFEERSTQLCNVQQKVNSCLPPVQMQVKIETENDSVDTSADSIVDANSADAEALSADFDANQIRSTPMEPELLEKKQETAKNLISVDADEPGSTIEPLCLISQVKTELTIFEMKKEIIPPFKNGEIKIENSEISSEVTRKTRFTPKQMVQEAFSFQLENNNSLPAQSQEEMKGEKLAAPALPRSRSEAPTEVRRSIRNKFVSSPVLRIESAAEEIKFGNTSHTQNPAIKNNVKLTPLPKWRSVVEEDKITSRLKQTSSSFIVEIVEITPVPQKPVQLMEAAKIGLSQPQKSSRLPKVQITSIPQLLLHRLKPTSSHSEKQQNKPTITGTDTTSEGENGRLNQAKNKNYVCGICAKKFSWRRSLTRHSESHKTEENRKRPFKCPLCEKSFLLSYHLKDHLRRHSNKTPFECSHAECDKSFKTKTNLISHLKSHSDFRPFKCSVRNCDKAYRQKVDLKEHIRTHTCTGERNYICTVHPCSKGFLSAYQLKRHFLRVHAEKKVKPSPAGSGKA